LALPIDQITLTWRVLAGGDILAVVTVDFTELVILTGVPDWELIDGQGNDHKSFAASPHIQPTDDLVDYVRSHHRAQPQFGPYQLRVAGGDMAVTNQLLEPIPAGDYPVLDPA
jgi:hypothetical protein